jgi:predicted acetyltransferase
MCYRIDTVDVRLLEPASGDLSISRGTAAALMPEIKTLYRSFVANRILYLHRSGSLWLSNAIAEHTDGHPLYAALCTAADGTPQGYVIYTLIGDRVEHRARGQELEIRDLVALSLDAYRTLWSFLASHDLVGRIRWDRAPSDDPLPELLAEPRMLHQDGHEGLWLRLVEIPAALRERGYLHDGETCFSVTEDPLTPWNDGTYRLTVHNGDADVERTSQTPQWHIDRKALASAWCGRHRLNTLANWGLVSGDQAAIDRADALLATRHEPHCPDHF